MIVPSLDPRGNLRRPRQNSAAYYRPSFGGRTIASSDNRARANNDDARPPETNYATTLPVCPFGKSKSSRARHAGIMLISSARVFSLAAVSAATTRDDSDSAIRFSS